MFLILKKSIKINVKYLFIVVLIGLMFFSTSVKSNDSTQVKSDSLLQYKIGNLQNGISDLQSKIDSFDTKLSNIKIEVSELSNRDTFWGNAPSNIFIGLVASLLTLLLVWIFRELSYLNRFGKLKGNYYHKINDKIEDGCITEIKYVRGGKLEFNTKTLKGNWEGLFTMDKSIPTNGSGVYRYTNNEEMGFMYLIIDSEKDVINVFPITLSHLSQKVHFYKLVRK